MEKIGYKENARDSEFHERLNRLAEGLEQILVWLPAQTIQQARLDINKGLIALTKRESEQHALFVDLYKQMISQAASQASTELMSTQEETDEKQRLKDFSDKSYEYSIKKDSDASEVFDDLIPMIALEYFGDDKKKRLAQKALSIWLRDWNKESTNRNKEQLLEKLFIALAARVQDKFGSSEDQILEKEISDRIAQLFKRVTEKEEADLVEKQ